MTLPHQPEQVRLDARNLRGIAHPVRVRLLATLRASGPATASGLARELGLNTGATSYHLRQLAEHGFITELPDRGLRRERWWEAAHADTAFPEDELLKDDTGLGAAFLRSVGQVAADNMLRAIDARPTIPEEWRGAEDFSDYALTLTPAQAKDLTTEIHAVLRRHRAASPDTHHDTAEGAARVTFQFQLFANLDDLGVQS
jgi:DNA-binding transcriptional ArsR family regulator